MQLSRSFWIAIFLSLALAFSFVAWAMQALRGGPLLGFDHELAERFTKVAGEHDLRRTVVIGFTHTGGVPAMAFLALIGVLWQWRRGDRSLAIAWALIVVTGGMLNFTLKKSFDRQRPPAFDSERRQEFWRDSAVTETNESFPSGHSTGSLIGYGLFLYAVFQATSRLSLRISLSLLLILLVAAIGFSRIYLRAHWFSDVVGGFLIGGAWLSFGLAWVVQWRSKYI